MTAKLALILALVLPLRLAAAGGFDWDAYNDRRDACTAHDQILQQCSQNYQSWCDLALRQSERRCSPSFGTRSHDRRTNP